jgi:plastocyanin
MRRITWLIALALAAGALAAAGCGGDDNGGGSSSSSSSSGGGPLTLTADPGGAISWDKNQLSAKAGSVTIKLVNESTLPHGVEIEGNGVEKASKVVTGGDAEVTVDLKPGKYEYYCPVGTHKQTMKGALTVQ